MRTLAGNYQLLARMPRLLVPIANPSWLELMSHKVMRLFGPWLLLTFLVASTVAAAPLTTAALQLSPTWLMRAFALGQLFLYLLAVMGPRAGWAGVVYRTFVVLNAAAMLAYGASCAAARRLRGEAADDRPHPLKAREEVAGEGEEERRQPHAGDGEAAQRRAGGAAAGADESSATTRLGT